MQKPTSNTLNTISRQWQILSQLERKRWIGTTYIKEQLNLMGFQVSLRTIQRDLNALAERFPLEKNNANPQGWRWREDAPMQSLPHMSVSQAIAFSMLKDNLTQLLPPAVLSELYPWFKLVEKQLKCSKISQTWLNRVRILSANQPLIAPDVNIQAKEAIYDAVFTSKQLKAIYKGRGRAKAKTYLLNPIAIVQRGIVIYLLASYHDRLDEIRQFALHRFEMAEIQETDANLPKNFNLDAYINTGMMGFNFPLFDQLKPTDQTGNLLSHQPPEQKIHLIFAQNAGDSLLETQLSHNQKTWQDDLGLHVTATVKLTSQLVWWLRGFGKSLRHIEPPILSMAVFENTPSIDTESH